MTENNTKFTKPQFIIGVIVLVIILFFVFSNKPATEQTPNSQDKSVKEFIKLPTSIVTTEPSKTPDSLTSEDKLRAKIRKYFEVYMYREWNRPARDNEKDAFDTLITEIKIEDGVYGKTIIVKYNSAGGVIYDLFDGAGIIYKAIFTYGERVQKAVVEAHLPTFQDKYGNECKVFVWANKIDNPTTIIKVNWENIPSELVEPWWEETYLADLDAINCK